MNRLPTQQTQPEKSRCGFTLVELVAALVIGSTLIVSTLGLLRTATRYNIVARKESQLQPALGLLAEQIERDFINARAISFGTNSVAICGFMGESSPETSLEPAIVEYRIQFAGTNGDGVLFRSETQPLTGARTIRQPMLVGATSFNIAVLAESDEPIDVSGLSFGYPMRAMPTHLQIVIGDNTNRTLLVKDILKRDGVN